MEKCRFRIPVQTKAGDEGIKIAANQALRGQPISVLTIAGELKQTFCNGLCQLLTVKDIGPMECRQPNHSEKTCPDIKGIT